MKTAIKTIRMVLNNPTDYNLKNKFIEVQIKQFKIKNYQNFFIIQNINTEEKIYSYEEGFFNILKFYGINKQKYLKEVKTELERLCILEL